MVRELTAREDSLVRFKLLVAMVEQLGYHFAKICPMAGDPKA
jgi:hypothetical protein